MASQDPADKDAAMKQRIITHMNSDHRISLSYYLRYYKKLSSREAASPTLTDITFTAMTIVTGDKKSYTIPLTPPMKSWTEARQRCVDMDSEAREGLGISSIKITEYEPPTSLQHRIIATFCAVAMISFAAQKFIVPGTVVYDQVLSHFPGGAAKYMAMQKLVGGIIWVAHTAEAFLFDQKKMSKYGVERGSALWWKWIASVVLEGQGAFQRVDATVARKKGEAEKAKH
ncbi:hypothetical protein HYFRA_00012369 [Hymenoscyphus fraxineus]|uniref:DUF2470 domain-containing protein n=1 Tax=Hymenoscyphus fraxineus TaxID=746836 RepID=A0A9N9PKB8_9HELO|nr:hypothetical protein HYFRA_00012369 [Hymenoscyphus fraxineus]